MGQYHQVTAIILAAGKASRMGQAKQMLLYKSTPLIQWAVDAVLSAGITHYWVVTGAHHELLHPYLKRQQIPYIHNPDWEEGMGSSIRTGMKAISEENHQLLITLADQVNVKGELLRKMLDYHRETGKLLTAASYNETLGVPAIFEPALFPELRSLSGPKGARPILNKYQDTLALFPFPQAAYDVDTPEDYQRLLADDP